MRRYRKRNNYKSDINVTPFVDVMLVLLIIFMVSAPLLHNGVTIDMPKTEATALDENAKVINLSINEKGQYYVDDLSFDSMDVALSTLQSKTIGKAANQALVIKCDKGSTYDLVLKFLAALQKKGYKKITLAGLLGD